MADLTHAFFFLLSAVVVWFSAGILIDSITHIAKRFKKTSFTVAFFVLGIMTSISEISVAFNSTLDKVPQVSAGNIVGASFVIMLLIIPLLAISNGGISLRHTLSRKNLLLALMIILLPSLLLLDGSVTPTEGWFILFSVMVLLYSMRREKSPMVEIKEDLMDQRSTSWELVKVIVGAIFIFAAGNILVKEAVFFADSFSVPKSLIGLLLLGVGTNVPEIVLAFRSIKAKHTDIAFGDYVGSSVMNAPIFGVLAIANGKFAVEVSEFWQTATLFLIGLILFYIFAGTKNKISRNEGLVLVLFYLAFLGFHLFNFAKFSGS